MQTFRGKRETGENLYRRSLYTFWKRAAPPASLDILGAPNRETCVVRRERTNTPLHALVTLNDVQFVEAARHLAQVTLKEGVFDGSFIAERLIQSGVKLKMLKEEEIDLEDVFMGITKGITN